MLKHGETDQKIYVGKFKSSVTDKLPIRKVTKKSWTLFQF